MAGSFETPEDLPRALRSWAGRCLSDESAPLLTSVLLTWACDATDEASRVQWRELNDLCRDSEFGFGHSRADAVEERDRSRAADASLGTGPVMVDFSPPEPQGASEAAETRWMEAEHGKERGTFGSSRDASIHIHTMNAALMPLPKAGRTSQTIRLRFQIPGPGAYSPDVGSVPFASTSHTSLFPQGATWGRDDRYKHLSRAVTPSAAALSASTPLPPLSGPSSGFYPMPVFPAPKERASGIGSRCRARLFPPAAMLPGGQPPERIRERIEAVRELNKKTLVGPDPCSYSPGNKFNSEFPTKSVGRLSAQGLFRPSTALDEEGASVYEIERQAEEMRREARDRRYDQRRREDVEVELNRVRQKHLLLAAGAKRSIGQSAGSERSTSSGEMDVLAELRKRLDGSLQRMSDLFSAIDVSWDGLVSREELGVALAGLGLDVSRDEVRALFDRIDVDRSGEIDFRELKRALYRPPSSKKNSAEAAHSRWEAAKTAARPSTISDEQLKAYQGLGIRRRAGAHKTNSPWATGPGRKISVEFLSGMEPPETKEYYEVILKESIVFLKTNDKRGTSVFLVKPSLKPCQSNAVHHAQGAARPGLFRHG
ncbi:hypothetical protein Ctob_004713 [Chrysochromulina tobinii]|uniref:EF-hand domain-containing protein n=1 Tax=Chrysochromulina tobinii TaxID=1460289 RepID=A0A0M0JN74_9EUKA|nr:hypothetical protein Ctob_004713 [Chrysochromulina tobinii]|eukprot:KOO28019.1 hypothetical protein Ctob_004713 [Chrysochromulina sp. CCMP291]